MFRTKKILTQIGNSGAGKHLSMEDLRLLQNHLIKMYRDVENVCIQHNLQICWAYGNVIGAARHGGWIPWDDDLDVHMPRKDYELLLTEYADELPHQYKISSYHSPEGSYTRFAKIFDTSTTFVPLGGESDVYSHVFIDIFPIDYCPNNKILNKVSRLISFFMMYTATSVVQVKSESKAYKKLMFGSNAGKFNWWFRQIWGKCFSFISPQTWHKWIEKLGQNKVSSFVHVMSDTDICYKALPSDLFYPFQQIKLPEIGIINVPNNHEKYLSFFYGDWKKIPDDKDKWHHYVTDFKIPNNNQ